MSDNGLEKNDTPPPAPKSSDYAVLRRHKPSFTEHSANAFFYDPFIDPQKLVEAAGSVLKSTENPAKAWWIGPDGKYLIGNPNHSHVHDAEEIIKHAGIEDELFSRIANPIFYLVRKASFVHIVNSLNQEFGVDLSSAISEAGIKSILDLGVYFPNGKFRYTILVPDNKYLGGDGLENLRKDLAKARAGKQGNR